MIMIISYALTATVSALLGLIVLHKAWKTKQVKVYLRLLGWACLVLSVILWAISSGKDRGVAIGLIVISVLALIFIAVQAYRDTPIVKSVKHKKTQQNKPATLISRLTLLKRVGIFLWVFLGCAVMAFIIALGSHELLWQAKIHASNSLVIMLFLFPILWAALSTFSLTSSSVRLKVSVFLTPTFLSLIVLWHFNIGVS